MKALIVDIALEKDYGTVFEEDSTEDIVLELKLFEKIYSQVVIEHLKIALLLHCM